MVAITPVMTFSPLTAAQASPFGGMQQAMFGTASSIKDLQKQQMQNQLMQEQLKTFPAMQQAELAALQQKAPGMQLQNQMLQEQLKTMPQMQQALLAEAVQKGPLLQAKINRYNQMASMAAHGAGMPQSPIGKLQYDIEKAIEKYGPDSAEVKSMKSQRDATIALMVSRGNMFQTNVETAPYRIQPKQQKEQIIENIMNQGPPAHQAAQVAANLGKFFPLAGQQPGQTAPSVSPSGEMQPAQAVQPSAFENVLAAQSPEDADLAKQQVNEVRSIKMKSLLTNQAQKALTASDKFESYAKAAEKNLDAAAQYTGPAGAALFAADNAKRLAGQEVKRLNDYNQFLRDVSLSLSESAIGLNTPAQIESQKRHEKLMTFDMLSSNPKSFKTDFHNAVNSISRSQASNIKTVQSIREDFLNKNKNEGSPQSKKSPNIPLSVPDFSSPDEFGAWYAGLSNLDKKRAQQAMRK